jgi:DNA-binding transcriptional LysR family regulator
MLDRVTGMQIFVRVASLGGFSAAARSLGMSATMATKHVAALEERLGVKLLHRTTRKVTLTEAGRRYLDGAERVLAEVDEVEAETSADRFDVRGTLRINAPVSFGVREIAPRLPGFGRQYEDLAIDLGLNDRLVDLIEEGWDLAIRIGVLRNSSLIARKLAPCRTAVCAAPEYLRTHGHPVSVHDLTDHNCLGYTLSRALGDETWSFGAKGEMVVPIRRTLRANNGDALVAAAINGHGITYQPTFLVAAALASGELLELALDHPTIQIHDVYAVYPENRRPPAKVRAFIDYLVDQFSPEPPWDRR